nr:immunoglobulin heavy chain junction region [Macaca mulatta]
CVKDGDDYAYYYYWDSW